MKATKPLSLLWVAIPGTLLSYGVVAILVMRGLAVPLSPNNLSLTLVAIAVVLALLAIPIFRYRAQLRNPKTNQRAKRVDPFYAVRVVLLAKATTLAGTLFLSWHLGVIAYQLFAPILIFSSMARNVFGLVASALMIASGLIVEYWCRLPEDGDADPTNPQATA